MSRRLKLLRLVVSSFLCSTLLPAAPPQAEPQRTSQLKATFLHNLAMFTDWPADAYSEPAAPLNVCVMGDEWVPRELEYRITGKSANGREMRVRKPGLGPEVRNCQVLLIGSLEKKQLPKLMQLLQGTSVLTVSDIDNFIEAGGAIRFSVVEDRVRFVVNLVAVEGARLRISSKLLNLSQLAKNVRRSGGN